VIERISHALIDGGRNHLVVIGDLPQQFAVGRLFHVFIGKAGDLFVAVQYQSDFVAARDLFQLGREFIRLPISKVSRKNQVVSAFLHGTLGDIHVAGLVGLPRLAILAGMETAALRICAVSP